MARGNYTQLIQPPVSRQPMSWSQYGKPVRDAIGDLDDRVTKIETVGVGLLAPLQNVTTNGTATTAVGTEIRDSAVSDYVFQSTAGVRVKMSFLGRAITGSVAGGRFSYRMRYTMNGASPAITDTQAGHDDAFYVPVTTSAGSGSRNLVVSFIPGAGLCTVAVFIVQLSGSGTGQPTGTAEFYGEFSGNL